MQAKLQSVLREREIDAPEVAGQTFMPPIRDINGMRIGMVELTANGTGVARHRTDGIVAELGCLLDDFGVDKRYGVVRRNNGAQAFIFSKVAFECSVTNLGLPGRVANLPKATAMNSMTYA